MSGPPVVHERVPSPWSRFGWLMGAIWLVFLGFVVGDVLVADVGVVLKVVALAAIGLFAGIYIHGLMRCMAPVPADPVAGVRHLVPMLALMGMVAIVAKSDVFGMSPYVVALAMFSLPAVWAVVIAATAVLLPPALALVREIEADSAYLGAVSLLVAVSTGLVRFLESNDERHQKMSRELDLVSERERVARDVHDLLGHSLTVVAAKAELAERLIDTDPERSRAELLQIQSLTRQALAEIRATVAGLRIARLGDELEAARDALDAAGIEADLDTDVDVVDPRHRIVLAWVVREAVTNVVRHSRARHCTISLAAGGLTVSDDGVGPSGVEGNGLRGIRERVAGAGGRLELRPGPGDVGTTLEVVL